MRRATPAILAAILSVVGSQASLAQQRVSITAPLEQQWPEAMNVLQTKIVALAKEIPADKYSWRPSDQVRTVSQVLMHVAGEWYYMCPVSVAAKPPADFGAPGAKMRQLEQVTDKTEVLAHLDKSWAHCRAALDAIDPARLVPDSLPAKMGFPRIVLLMTGDQHEHLGQLIAYARSIGVTPPWSK